MDLAASRQLHATSTAMAMLMAGTAHTRDRKVLQIKTNVSACKKKPKKWDKRTYRLTTFDRLPSELGRVPDSCPRKEMRLWTKNTQKQQIQKHKVIRRRETAAIQTLQTRYASNAREWHFDWGWGWHWNGYCNQCSNSQNLDRRSVRAKAKPVLNWHFVLLFLFIFASTHDLQVASGV